MATIQIFFSKMNPDELMGMFIEIAIELGNRQLLKTSPINERLSAILDDGDLGSLAQVLAKELANRGITPAANQETPVLNTPLSDSEQALAETGRKIYAIKEYKNRTFCSLREAKDTVDAWAENVRVRKLAQVTKVLLIPGNQTIVF